MTGGGAHVWWLLDRPLTLEQWQPLGKAWKKFAGTRDLTRDLAHLANPATLMRFPGTWTSKRETYVVGKVLDVSYSPEHIMSICGAEPVAVPQTAHSIFSSGPARIGGTLQYAASVGTGGRRDLPLVSPEAVTTGCGIVANYVASKGNVPEPLWFSMAALAGWFEEGAHWFHATSSGDPRYDPGQAQAKFDRCMTEREVPPTCEELRDLVSDEGSPCATCPLRTTITSPYEAATRVLVAPPDPNADGGDAPSNDVILPPNYMMDAASRRIKVLCPDNSYKDVFYHPLYPLRLQHDHRDDSYILRLRFQLDEERWRYLDVKMSEAATPQSFAKYLATRGVFFDASDPLCKRFQRYCADQARYIHQHQSTDVIYSSMGWHEKNFVLGDRVFKPSAETEVGALQPDLLKYMDSLGLSYAPEGDLEDWKATALRITSHPKLRRARLALALGFGAPLIHMTGLRESIVVGFSGPSGCGKSVTMKLVSSIYGSPISNHITKMDTSFAQTKLLALLGAIPVCLDELTGSGTEDALDKVFMYSGGRTRAAGTDRGKLRANESWQTMVLYGTNQNIYTASNDTSADSSGERYRVLEMDLASLDKLGANQGQVEGLLQGSACGIAGEAYLRYLVGNYKAVRKSVLNVQAQLEKKFKPRGPERFWVALTATVAVAGAHIANHLKLYPFDIKELVATLHELIDDSRERISDNSATPEDMLRIFIRDHMRHVLVTESGSALPTSTSINNVNNGLSMRIDRHKGVLAICLRDLRTWAHQKRTNGKVLIEAWDKTELVKHHAKSVRLYAGTGVTTAPEKCVVLNLGKVGEFTDGDLGD